MTSHSCTSITVHQGHETETPIAHIAGVTSLTINSQEELDAIHRLVAEGGVLPLKPAPGSRQPRQRPRDR